MKKPIYLDHHSTTPVAPEVLAQMLPFFSETFGNAMSSQHSHGWQAQTAVEKAREQVARLISAQPREIVFTSGATESVHLAILGLFFERGPFHIITAAAEHKCVLEACARAQSLGCQLTILPVNEYAQVSVSDVESALTPQTALVSLAHANNEIGSLNPIAEIGTLTRSKNIYFHVDAAQTLGKHTIHVEQMKIDLLSVSAHKLYGPKGVGALYVKQSPPRVRLKPYLGGGGQERGLRSGTVNVPGIVGFGAACELAQSLFSEEPLRLKNLRDHMIKRLLSECSPLTLNGHPTERLVHNVSVSLSGLLQDELLLGLRDLAFSTASACSAGGGFSHVLRAIGQKEDERLATLRFGLGRSTTLEQVDFAVDSLRQLLSSQKS
jgi:cysteine desulfurase